MQRNNSSKYVMCVVFLLVFNNLLFTIWHFFFFFFKQKTAYEIRKGDWSSDVCSSDLYFRSGNACGKQVKLLRFDIGTVSPVLVAALSTGRDADGTFVFTDGLSSDHVYYGQFNCARSDFDIYVVDNAELLRGRGADGSDG